MHVILLECLQEGSNIVHTRQRLRNAHGECIECYSYIFDFMIVFIIECSILRKLISKNAWKEQDDQVLEGWMMACGMKMNNAQWSSQKKALAE